MASERAIEAFLRFALDRQSVEKVKQGSKSIEDALKGVRERAEKVEQKMDEVRNWAGYFGDLSTSALFFGAALSGPILLGVNQFVSQAGLADQTSRNWLSATDDLSKSYQRVGRVGAETLLPFLETAADVAEKIAAFTEAHPGAVRAALFSGGALVGLSAVGEAVERGIRIYTDAKSLYFTTQQVLAGRLMQQAADKQLAAAAGMNTAAKTQGVAGAAGSGLGKAAAVAGSVVGGAVIGGQIVNKIKGDEDYSGRFLRQTLTLPSALTTKGLLALGEKTGALDPETARELGNSFGKIYEQFGNTGVQAGLQETGKFLGIVADSADKLKDAGDAAEGAIIPQQALQGFIAYQQANTEATKQHEERRRDIIEQAGEARTGLTERTEEQRTKIIEEFGRQQAQATEDFERQRTRQQRDFDQDLLKAQEGYQASRFDVIEQFQKTEQDLENDNRSRRQEIAEKFGKEAEKQEAEHQKNMRRLQEDHQLRLADAIRAQDVRAFLQEQRTYEVQRRRRVEDQQDQVRQRSADQSEQLAEIEQNFREQKEARQQALIERLVELRDNYAQEREQRIAAFEQRQADQQADFDLQQQRAEEQNRRTLDELDRQAAKELEAINEKQAEQIRAAGEQYRKEREARETAFADQLRDLDAALLGEKDTRLEYYAAMETDFRDWLANMQGELGSNLPGFPGRQAGGYVGAGLYKMHPNEFVLNQGATRRAEQMIGGPLTQSNLLAALAGRGGMANRSMSFTQQNHFTGRDDAQMIVAQIDRQIDEKLLRLERGY